jgi:hypothetical protein
MPQTRTAPAAVNGPKEFKVIPLVDVQSSQVKAIGYDAGTKTLALTFAHGPGTVYHYPNVEADLHAAFVAAESIGTFFGKHIKPLPFKKFAPPAAD